MHTSRQRPAARSVVMPEMTRITDDQWSTLREIRLSALRESPQMFLSTEDREKVWEQPDWEAEFKRGDWYFGEVDDSPVALIGVTREPEMPPRECYIEYMWVSPDYRRQGMAQHLLRTLLNSLRDSGVDKVMLWVLDGNYTAVRLYERLGFKSTNEVQPILTRPGRTEARMLLYL